MARATVALPADVGLLRDNLSCAPSVDRKAHPSRIGGYVCNSDLTDSSAK